MSTKRERLERQGGGFAGPKIEHTMNTQRDDYFSIWNPDGRVRPGDPYQVCNLSLTDVGNDSVVTLYGLSREQLAALYAQLGRVLGKPSSASIQHLRQLQRHLNEVFPPKPDTAEIEFD